MDGLASAIRDRGSRRMVTLVAHTSSEPVMGRKNAKNTMSRYELRFAKGSACEPKIIHFGADDASMALILAHCEAPDRLAALSRDERRVCSIRRTRVDHSEIWLVGGGAHE